MVDRLRGLWEAETRVLVTGILFASLLTRENQVVPRQNSSERERLTFLPVARTLEPFMIHGFLLATDALRAVFLSQADLVLENLALRQQLAAFARNR